MEPSKEESVALIFLDLFRHERSRQQMSQGKIREEEIKRTRIEMSSKVKKRVN